MVSALPMFFEDAQRRQITVFVPHSLTSVLLGPPPKGRRGLSRWDVALGCVALSETVPSAFKCWETGKQNRQHLCFCLARGAH